MPVRGGVEDGSISGGEMNWDSMDYLATPAGGSGSVILRLAWKVLDMWRRAWYTIFCLEHRS